LGILISEFDERHAARAIIKLPNHNLLEELMKLSSETAGAFDLLS